MERQVIMLTDAPTRALALINNLQLHPPTTRGTNSVPVIAKQNYARGRVNHLAMEEAQEALDIVLGIFLINATSAVVLFDSRASLSFIFAAYVEKHDLPISLLKVNLKIRVADFVTNLIVLESKGIDVILGMDW
jgi:hypothetical protein